MRNTRFSAPGATVDSWMSRGATSYAACTSAPVGATWGAPGTSERSLTLSTMLEAVSSVRGYFASWLREKSSRNVTVLSSNVCFDWTNTPSSLDEPVCLSSTCRSLITCDFWFTHWIGSVCNTNLLSTARPPAKTTRLATASGTAARGESEPSHTTRRPSGPSRKSWPFVGDLYSRMPSTASVPTMLFRQIAATPTMSSRPNCRSIGTLA